MRYRVSIALSLATAAMFASLAAFSQTTTAAANGEALFNARCKSCHEPAIDRAPTRAELAVRAPANIVQALTSGAMAPAVVPNYIIEPKRPVIRVEAVS